MRTYPRLDLDLTAHDLAAALEPPGPDPRRAVEAGLADLIAFGRPFIANPDLPERIANGWPLNPLDPATVYGGAEKGLTDYPTYSD